MDLFVKEWREKRGMSRRQLAFVSGISRQTVIKIEQGKVLRPRPETLRALARILQCEVSSLYVAPPFDLPPVQRPAK